MHDILSFNHLHLTHFGKRHSELGLLLKEGAASIMTDLVGQKMNLRGALIPPSATQ